MALAVTIFKRGVEGGTVKIYGKYVLNGGSTGGDIKTGLKEVWGCVLQPKGSAVVANQPCVDETFPLRNGGDVTFVTTADQEGTFEAYGLGY